MASAWQVPKHKTVFLVKLNLEKGVSTVHGSWWESITEEVYFYQGLVIGIRLKVGVVRKSGVEDGSRGCGPSQRRLMCEAAHQLYSHTLHTQSYCLRAPQPLPASVLSIRGGHLLQCSSPHSPGRPDCHHLPMQHLLSGYYILDTSLGIWDTKLKIYSSPSQKASWSFTSKTHLPWDTCLHLCLPHKSDSYL